MEDHIEPAIHPIAMRNVIQSFRNFVKSPERQKTRSLWPAFLVAIFCAALPVGAQAQDESFDFENIAPNLPGWRGLGSVDSEQKSWGLSQPGFPFIGSLDGMQPHAGGNCLKVEFTQDVTNVGIMLMNAPVSGGSLEVSFFIRSEGIGADGLLSLYQYDSGGQRTQLHWGISKVQESSTWSEVTCKINLLPDTASIRFSVSYPSVPAGAKIWIDDITLKMSN